MKKFGKQIRDTLIAGLLFLLPVILLIVLANKAFQMVTGLGARVAGWFGLKSFAGISGGTIMTSIGLIVLCYVCGYLMRISFFKSANQWLDKKLMNNIPFYKTYREMAMAKLDPHDQVLPYKYAAWLKEGGVSRPCFVLEQAGENAYVVFLPVGGNVKEGTICKVPSSNMQILDGTDVKTFLGCVAATGVGLGKY